MGFESHLQIGPVEDDDLFDDAGSDAADEDDANGEVGDSPAHKFRWQVREYVIDEGLAKRPAPAPAPADSGLNSSEANEGDAVENTQAPSPSKTN